MSTKLFLFVLVSFTLLSGVAQGQSNAIEIKGVVIDSITNESVPFASVLLLNKNTKKIITGTKTDDAGNFLLQATEEAAYLQLSYIGYENKLITNLTGKNGVLNLGKIYMQKRSGTLKVVEVIAEKSTTEFELDKRVFNVGQDISSSGASALDVLNNVPAVNVNIEGVVSLRGSSGVQILINGKPSVLASESGNALGTITADMIEKIEVITNPSAKYEAEGSAGILNIVLKKEKKKGVNGSASVNLGWPHNQSVGLSLNRRTEKFNLFSQLGAGYRELPRYEKSINSDLINNTTINSSGTEYRNEQFYNFILGTDYYIDAHNILTLSGSLALEVEEQPSAYNFTSVNASSTITSAWNRTEITEALNPKYQYELQYKREFKDNKEHTLLMSAIGNFFGKDQGSSFKNVTIEGANNDGEQNTRTNFKEAKYTFNIDYTKPFKEHFTMEAGAQYQLQDVRNDFEVSDLVNTIFVVNDGLTNVFNYSQNVLGVYTTGAYEKDKFGLKLGMRVETTDLNTLLENTGETNNQHFTNLFPSAHASYKVTKLFSVQAGYSRRIYRPRLWDLNPFFNIRNNFSIRVGNPNLLPEYTDSYELSGIYLLPKMSLNLNVYQRNTTAVIERISFFEDNIATVRPENIGETYSTGLEFNADYEPHKKLKFIGEFGYNYFNRVGQLNDLVFDFNAQQWNTMLRTKYAFPKDLDIEVTGRYRSAFQTIQGRVSQQLFADIGLRKKILKKRAVINFSIRDIFASRIQETEVNQDAFYIYSRDYRGRFMTLGFSYSFGKGEAMEFTGARRR
jgi:outer membrane receptor protein involved in Fe transport